MTAVRVLNRLERVGKTLRAVNSLAVIGADRQQLLQAIEAAVDQRWLQEVPAVKTLRQVWAEQYIETKEKLGWREVKRCPT